MTKQDLIDRMKSLDACDDSIEWVSAHSGSAQEIWDACDRGDWMLWFASSAGVEPRLVGEATCLCAREALVFIPADENRPRNCIEVTEAYWRGAATIDRVREARNDAYAAAASAEIGDARRHAPAVVAAADYAAAVAAAVITATAYATYACATYFGAGERNRSLARSADLVRSVIPLVPR